MEDAAWIQLFGFAEKGGFIDYKFFLEVYKDQKK